MSPDIAQYRPISHSVPLAHVLTLGTPAWQQKLPPSPASYDPCDLPFGPPTANRQPPTANHQPFHYRPISYSFGKYWIDDKDELVGYLLPQAPCDGAIQREADELGITLDRATMKAGQIKIKSKPTVYKRAHHSAALGADG